MITKTITVTTLAALMLLPMTALLQAGPALAIEEDSFDFGYVPQRSKIAHVFWLKSVGDETLKITKVTPGCGCTKAPLEKSELAPGDSTRLVASAMQLVLVRFKLRSSLLSVGIWFPVVRCYGPGCSAELASVVGTGAVSQRGSASMPLSSVCRKAMSCSSCISSRSSLVNMLCPKGVTGGSL